MNNFRTTQRSREYYKSHHVRPMPLDVSTVNCFTDGSKSDEGTGAGYIIMSFQLRAQDYIYLGTYATVFQAEISAINMACLTLLDNGVTGKQIDFYIDSQSAIRALESYTLINKSVMECKRLCNKLCEMNNQVTLNWIPAHSGQLGNGIADGLAKFGASHPSEGVEPRLPVSQCVISSAIKAWGKEQHQRLWSNRSDCRQTKLILPSVYHRWNRGIYSYERRHLRILTQLVTGHASLKRHLYLMGMVDSPNCECGEPQEAVHLLTDCNEYREERMKAFGHFVLRPSEIREHSLVKMLRFAKYTGLWQVD